jgi:hypothetical protein
MAFQAPRIIGGGQIIKPPSDYKSPFETFNELNTQRKDRLLKEKAISLNAYTANPPVYQKGHLKEGEIIPYDEWSKTAGLYQQQNPSQSFGQTKIGQGIGNVAQGIGQAIIPGGEHGYLGFTNKAGEEKSRLGYGQGQWAPGKFALGIGAGVGAGIGNFVSNMGGPQWDYEKEQSRRDQRQSDREYRRDERQASKDKRRMDRRIRKDQRAENKKNRKEERIARKLKNKSAIKGRQLTEQEVADIYANSEEYVPEITLTTPSQQEDLSFGNGSGFGFTDDMIPEYETGLDGQPLTPEESAYFEENPLKLPSDSTIPTPLELDDIDPKDIPRDPYGFNIEKQTYDGPEIPDPVYDTPTLNEQADVESKETGVPRWQALVNKHIEDSQLESQDNIEEGYDDASQTMDDLGPRYEIGLDGQPTFSTITNDDLDAIMSVESGGADADSLARAEETEGAIGSFQHREIFREEIARLFPEEANYDPRNDEDSRRVTRKYLNYLIQEQGMTKEEAIKSYNAGVSGMKKGYGDDYYNKVESNKTQMARGGYMGIGDSPSGYSLVGGGDLPGKRTGDKNPAMLEDGEYVLNRNAVKKIGKGYLDWINDEQYPRFPKEKAKGMEVGGWVGQNSYWTNDQLQRERDRLKATGAFSQEHYQNRADISKELSAIEDIKEDQDYGWWAKAKSYMPDFLERPFWKLDNYLGLVDYPEGRTGKEWETYYPQYGKIGEDYIEERGDQTRAFTDSLINAQDPGVLKREDYEYMSNVLNLPGMDTDASVSDAELKKKWKEQLRGLSGGQSMEDLLKEWYGADWWKSE